MESVTATEPAPVIAAVENQPYAVAPKPHHVDEVAVVASSMSRLWDQEFDPYHKSLYSSLYKYSETAFFRDYDTCYSSNPYGFFLGNYLVTRTIGDGYHFEGPGANPAEDFFRRDRTRGKLELAYLDKVKYGSGFLDKRVMRASGRLVETAVLDPYTITIDLDIDPGSRTYGHRTYYQPRGGANPKLRADRLLHMKMYDSTTSAWPMSIFRPNLVFLQALLDCAGDSFEAMKRTAYAPIVAKLNLQGMKKEEKAAACKAFAESLEKLQSSANNFVVDKEHDIDLLGRGGGNAKLLPINDLIEPWMAIALINFAVPLGILQQGGANKSILEAQSEDARISKGTFRRHFKEDVENEILPLITNREVELVWNKPPASSPETREEMKILLEYFKVGAVSREYILDYFDIKDGGSTFFAPPVDPNQEMALEQAKKLAASRPAAKPQ